jgi:peptidoglycan/xylan/chitin deacetylase (PgdA/CDA1 family)
MLIRTPSTAGPEPAGRAPTYSRTVVVSLTFDDGRASQDLARRMLAEHGLTATFYLNSGRVGQRPRHLTWDEVDAIAADGHEIGGHTVNHPDLTTVEPDDARREVADDRVALVARGYEVTTFAYPFGAGHDVPAVRSAVEDAGYAVARRAWGLQGSGRPLAEEVPPSDRWAVRTPEGVEAGVTLDALQELVTSAEGHGGWVPLVFHDVGEGWGDRWTVPAETLDALLGWLVERGTVVRTVAQVAG